MRALGVFYFLTLFASTLFANPQRLNAELVADGLLFPVDVEVAAGDTARIFVVEQRTGTIRIVRNGLLEPTPFLNIGAKITFAGNEQGLLGIAFHPDFQNQPRFFVNYTDLSGDSVIAEYQVDANNPDMADANSERIVLQLFQPFQNHNGGGLEFGPDGYLYIGFGDGGSGGDPFDNAQNGQVLYGKMLRIDIDGALPYSIPPSNPFVNDPNFLDEIWALGLRNPWRYSFDSVTGDLWIGDVGQHGFEEVDFQPGSSSGGENYGWRLKEADTCFKPTTNCDPGGLTGPVWFYAHEHSVDRDCLTGGVVYRGASIPGFNGRYLCSDFSSGEFWSFRLANGTMVELLDHTLGMNPGPNLNIQYVSSFGVDANQEILMLDRAGGELWRLVHQAMTLTLAPLNAGAPASATLTGARGRSKVFLCVSLRGDGSTWISPLLVDLGLDSPFLVSVTTADPSGNASFNGSVPPGASWVGRPIWLQVAERGNTSNVVAAIIN